MLLFAPLLLALPQSSAPLLAGPDLLNRHRISAGELHDLEIQGLPGERIAFGLQLSGAPVSFELEAVSNRAPGFRLIVEGPAGSFEDVDPGPVDTYRGISMDGSVRAWLRFDGAFLSGSFRDERSAEGFELEPLPLEGGAHDHLLYRTADEHLEPVSCELFEAADLIPGLPQVAEAQGGGSTGLRIAELVADCDFQFFQANGSNVQNTRADVEVVVNRVNDDHYNDTNQTNDPEILHLLTGIVVRTSNDDPYSSSEPGVLLGQVGSAWSPAFFQGVPRDHVQLFTGKNLIGSTIGVAWLSGICGNQAQSVVQSRFSGSLTSRASLSSHELGHNWGSPHCDGTPNCHIMCPGLGGCNGLSGDFGPFALGQINALKDAKLDCLTDPAGGVQVPPSITGTDPTAIGAVASGGLTLTLTGSGFLGVDSVTLDGQALTQVPAEFAVIDDTTLLVLPSEALALGPHNITVADDFGNDSASFDVVYNAVPTADLSGAEGLLFTNGDTAIVRVGAQPNDTAYVFASFSGQPSILPGLVSLDIGNNFANLIELAILPVDPATGFVEVQIPLFGLPLLSTFRIQAAVLSSAAPTLPVPVTNVVSGAFLL